MVWSTALPLANSKRLRHGGAKRLGAAKWLGQHWDVFVTRFYKIVITCDKGAWDVFA